VNKGTFPGQSEGAGSINMIRNIAIKLGDFDGVARAWRAHYHTQQHPGECAPTHPLLNNRDSYTETLADGPQVHDPRFHLYLEGVRLKPKTANIPQDLLE